MSSLELILNASTAYGAPGGANAARVQNDVGDLCLWSSNNVGMRISAVTGYVGVGKTASYALDVSGSVNATGLYGCITDSLTVPISTLAASAYGLSNVYAMAGAALPRAGGTVTGALTVLGSLYASNVTVLGSTEVINAYETHSSNLVITNLGTGPALTVTQTEGGTAQPVAAFYAGIGAANPALMVTNAGQVGIGKSTAGFALDVSGSVNVSGNLICNNGKYLQSTNGYTALPGGILLQWGYNYCTSSSLLVYFPIAFSSAPYSIIATPADPGTGAGTASYVIGIQAFGSPTSTYFTIGMKNINGSSIASTYVNWFAIGPV